jgi:hypothetical protein
MKHLSLLVLFTCLSLQFGFSQVKKQFLDNKNAKTTIVIKEDAASDMDILNYQFDLNSIGMGQEIRIKTQQDPTKQPTVEVPLAEVPAEVPLAEVPLAEVPLAEVPLAEVPLAEVPLAEVPLAEVPLDVLTPKGKKTVKKAAAKKVVKERRMPARAVATMPRTKEKPTEIYYKGIGKSSTRKVKMKKRKLVKRKKIRKRKRRKIRCYSF